jgi:hypothetical protein
MRSGKVRFCHVISGYIRLNLARSGKIKLGPFMSG